MKMRRLKRLRQGYRRRTFTQIVHWTIRKQAAKIAESIRQRNPLFVKIITQHLKDASAELKKDVGT